MYVYLCAHSNIHVYIYLIQKSRMPASSAFNHRPNESSFFLESLTVACVLSRTLSSHLLCHKLTLTCVISFFLTFPLFLTPLSFFFAHFMSLSPSLTPPPACAHARPCARALSFAHAHSPARSRSLSRTRARSLSQQFSIALTHTRSPAHMLSFARVRSLSRVGSRSCIKQ